MHIQLQKKRKRSSSAEAEVTMQADQNRSENKYGNGVAWNRGTMIGKGGSGSVFMATLKNPMSKYACFPSIMAVKSAEVSLSASLQNEREVLYNVIGCPNVIRCFGDETTIGMNEEMIYNLLLEYGSGGTLADLIKKSEGNGLAECDVRQYTRSILRGLNHIHACGYVHCDLKPQNILLVRSYNKSGGVGTEFRAKIADLGLAKRDKQNKKRKIGDPYWNGTPMYMSPEAVVDRVQKPPSDIWALGCIVLEMLTGKSPWEGKQDLSAKEFLRQISEGNELPNIPDEISKEGKSFLKGCFVRKVKCRFTAEMLLSHPFVEGLVDNDDDEVEESKKVLDISAVHSVVFSDADDELCCSSFSEDWSDWSFLSEEESFSFCSEEEERENQVVSSSAQDEVLQVQESNVTSSNIRASLERVMKPLMKVSPQVPTIMP
ncbi:hypothetical protein LguiB_023080 [Lonicera macranthoides]